MDPEEATGESLGFVSAIDKCPSDESIWIGTEDSGILRIGRNGKRIRYTTGTGHLLSNKVKDLQFISNTTLYILYFDGKLSRYTPTEGFSQTKVSDEKITAIAKGKENILYAGTVSGKIIGVYPERRSIQAIPRTIGQIECSGRDELYVTSEDSGEIWRITPDGGISQIPALGQSIITIYPEENGAVWAGTNQGLYHYTEQGWTKYSADDGLPSNRVAAILKTASGEILIASSSGIYRVNVSESNVTKSNTLYPDETFLCGARTEGEKTVYYFGGTRGLAALTDGAELGLMPWDMAEEDEGHEPAKRHAFPSWILIVLPLLLLAGILIGRASPKKEKVKKEENPAAETDPLPTPEPHVIRTMVTAYPHKKPVEKTTAAESEKKKPGKDELFEILEKLERKDAPAFSSEVWELIKESYTDPAFSVETIAQKRLLSRVHVNRKLQQEIGVSPSAIIKACRMRAAQELMAAGDLTIAQIAERAGFSSATYFSSAFKEFFGHSPSGK